MLDAMTKPESDLTAACEDAAASGHRTVITRDGEPWAAVVPVDDLAWLESLEDRIDAELLRRARAEWQASGSHTATLDEVVARLGIEV
jgi:prevent-host-death family protein